jgi:hypothetical protein
MNRAFLVWGPCLAVSRHRTFRLLLGGHVEECPEVLMELLFLRGRRLGASPEEHDRYGEVLGDPFGDGSPMYIANDAAAYFLCALARGRCHGLRVERVVEPCLLVLESLLSLVELVEPSTLPLAVVLVLGRFRDKRSNCLTK